jgi:hypothetical protein
MAGRPGDKGRHGGSNPNCFKGYTCHGPFFVSADDRTRRPAERDAGL